MIIIPAIDIIQGKCVRLFQGDFSSSQIVSEDPVSLAKSFNQMGAKYIHIVDLVGARDGKHRNFDIMQKIIESINVPVQLGGGIRDMETIDMYIQKGISRLVLGTAAYTDRKLLKAVAKIYNEKIAVGIDAKAGFVSTDGWLNVTDMPYIEFAKRIEDVGIKTIIFTDISKDGMLQGPNFDMIFKLANSVSCKIIASGGIKSIDDLKVLKKEGIYGAIVGKALYSGDIILQDAMKLEVN